MDVTDSEQDPMFALEMAADVENIVETLVVAWAAKQDAGDQDDQVAEHEDEPDAVVLVGCLEPDPVKTTKQAVAVLALEHVIGGDPSDVVVEE